MTSTELDLAWVHPRLGGLARRDTTGLGSGLSRAVADRLGFDVALVRMAFIVLTFGAGLLLLASAAIPAISARSIEPPVARRRSASAST